MTTTSMMAPYQASLLDLQDRVSFGSLDRSTGAAGLVRTPLAGGAWIDVVPGWVGGADLLFERLARDVAWRAERRVMYDRVVDVPRMVAFFGEADQLPDPALDAAKAELDSYYAPEFPENFRTAGLCLYRDGRDSVAWHGDTIGRGRSDETMVAIVCLGAVRPLLLRPRGGGPVLRNSLGHGDLIVMGGSCQRTWEHAIAKSAGPVGPRISVQFRSPGVS